MSKKKVISLALCTALIAGAVPFAANKIETAYGGATKLYVTSSISVKGDSINSGDYYTIGKVYAKDSKLTFDDKCAVKASVTSKAQIKNLKDYGMTDLFTMTAKLNVNEIVSGGKISFGFGMASRQLGEDDSAEVAFTYDDGLCLEVNEYKDGSASAFLQKQKYSLLSLNTDIGITLKVESSGKIYLTLDCNGNTIKVLGGKKLSIDAQGNVGVFSVSTESGRNKFTVAEMETLAYVYDAPLTVESYTETFDNGYNANMFYSQASSSSMMRPSKLVAEDGQLKFQNVTTGYFTTKEVFSNFELTFDITDLGREAQYDEAGNVTRTISHWFMIGFGVDNYNDPASERINATFLQFDHMQHNSEARPIDFVNPTPDMMNNRYVLWHNGAAENIQGFSDRNLWNNDWIKDETVNLKFIVKDGVITMYLKLESEEDYGDPLYSYDLGITKTGYVRLYTYGGDGSDPSTTAVLNMTVDNFTIKNLDNPNVMQVKTAPIYKSNKLEFDPDFVYTTVTDDSDLLGNKLKG